MCKHLFRLLFGALFLVSAAAGFTGCSDDDDDVKDVSFQASPETLTFTSETELTQTVTIKANCTWHVKKSNLDWATIEPENGTGGGTITVTVSDLPAGTTSREGKISFSLEHPEWGPWGTAKSEVTVKQYGEGVGPGPSGDVIWEETVGKGDASKKPLIADYADWTKSGSGASTVTYSGGAKTSVRSSGLENGGSGHNEIFFGTAPTDFTVNTITLTPEQTKLQLAFIASRSVKDEATGKYDNTFDPSKLLVALSRDGANWTDITYTTAGGTETPYWVNCTADFTLAEAVDALYIRFKATESSAIRLDDMKLTTGIGGTVVNFTGEAPDPDKLVSVASVHAAADEGVFTVQGTIVATNSSRFMLKDDTGIIEVNLGWKNDATVVNYAPAIGQTVKVKGKTETFSNIRQINPSADDAGQVTKVSDGDYTQPAPVKWVAKDFTAFKDATSRTIQYVEFEGELADDQYYNVIIDGLDKDVLVGGISYPAEGFITAAVGDRIVVRGYVNGMTNKSKVVTFMAVSVELSDVPADPKITSVTPATLSFGAAGEAKDVTVAVNSAAEGLTIEAAANNEQFSAVVDGLKVTVTAKENATESKIEGTLTIKLMKEGAAVDTKTVELSQAGKSASGDTKGTYASMDIFTCTEDVSADGCYELGKSTFNEEPATGVKFGTSKKTGFFTSKALGVTGSRKLSFYAVAWTDKTATIYIRVNNGGSVSVNSVPVAANKGANGNMPLTITVTDSDYYTVDLTDLTENSTVTFSTHPEFKVAEVKDTSRAVMAGIQLY